MDVHVAQNSEVTLARWTVVVRVCRRSEAVGCFHLHLATLPSYVSHLFIYPYLSRRIFLKRQVE